MNNSEAKSAAIAENGHEKLCALLNDNVPEVRASAMYALGTFLADPNKTEQIVNIEHNIAISALTVMSDGSPMVRREFVIALSHIVDQAGPSKFLAAASQTIEEDQSQRSVFGEDRGKIIRGRQSEWRAALDGHFGSSSYDSVYAVIWKALLNLSVDPHPDVSKAAAAVVDYINALLLSTPLIGEYASNLARESAHQQATQDNAAYGLDRSSSFQSYEEGSSSGSRPPNSASPLSRRPVKLTRSVSFASTLRTIYNFGNTSSNLNAPPTTASDLEHQQQQQSERSPTTISKQNSGRGQQPPVDDSTLPLLSCFYDWSCEYFTEPQMRVSSTFFNIFYM
jgi:regulator-associated protein of mTOR